MPPAEPADPAGAGDGSPDPTHSVSFVSPPSPTAFLVSGRTGRWRWPWAVAGTATAVALVIAAASVAGSLEERVSLWLAGSAATEVELLADRVDTYIGFVLFAVSLALPVLLISRIVHGQPVRHLLGWQERFAWPLFWRAAGAFLLAISAGFLVTAFTEPEAIARVPDLAARLPWMALALPVIFCQAFAEDYVFKGYLVRTWGAVVPVPWLVAVVIAAVFTAGHAVNDDVVTDLAFNLMVFFAGEIILIMIYLRAGNLAAATGLHWMNNVWSMCLVATLPGQSSGIAVATYTDPQIAAGGSHIGDPVAYLEVIALYGVLWLLTMHPRSPFCLVAMPQRNAA